MTHLGQITLIQRTAFVLKQKAPLPELLYAVSCSLEAVKVDSVLYRLRLSLTLLTSAVCEHFLKTCCVHTREPHFLVKGRPRCFVKCFGVSSYHGQS